MSDPIWVPLAAVYVIHDRQIARHGGASGLRDKTLLEAAVKGQKTNFLTSRLTPLHVPRPMSLVLPRRTPLWMGTSALHM
jgi:hypothetical protein